jgi:hypothetical protein
MAGLYDRKFTPLHANVFLAIEIPPANTNTGIKLDFTFQTNAQ